MDAHGILVVVAGLIAPLLNALLRQPTWSSRRTWLVTLLTSVGLGAVATGLSGGFTTDQLVAAVTAIVTISQGLYHLWLKGGSVITRLEQMFVFVKSKV